MKKLPISIFAAVLGVLALTLSAAACQFSFSYGEITAPLGTAGEIGVRVQKDHANCTLPGTDEYQFAWENIQVLGETAWEEIGPDLYERWFQVSLSEVGDGYLMISKDCTKEGYEEAILLITVLDPAEDGIWYQAYSGTYPLEELETGTLENAMGNGVIVNGILTISELVMDLPVIPSSFDGDVGSVRVFYTATGDEGIVPLLIATEGFLLRFDHLASDGT
jgi:hypothetical protein